MALSSPNAVSPAAAAFLLVSLALVTPIRGQVLNVLDVIPVPHAVDVSTGTAVNIRFDQPLKPATVNVATFRVYGRWGGPMTGQYLFSENDTLVRFQPDRPFQPGEQVTVMLSDRLRTPAGVALEGGYEFGFWTCPARGSGIFELADEIDLHLPGEGFLQSYGIYAGDFDKDGAPDFCIPTEHASDVRMLLNDRCGGFSAPVAFPLTFQTGPSSNEGQDFDRDGNIDFATAGIQSDKLVILYGDGAGSFTHQVELPVGDTPRGVAILDGDGDGDPDIVTAHRNSSDMGFLCNNGAGVFDPVVLFEAGLAGETAVVSADVDNDGQADLFVAGYFSSAVAIMLGNGDGTWTTNDIEAVGAQPWMAACGDIDLDGFPDVATCDSNSLSASIVFSDGQGGLLPRISLPIGNFSTAIDLGDIDGDGDLDIVASSFAEVKWTLWFNDGTGQFLTSQDLPASVAASCATLVDYDRDGLLDIVGLDEMADTVRLWRQTSPIPLGVQPSTCGATFRIDNRGALGGYGGTDAVEVSPGGIIYLGASTGEPAVFGLFTGLPFAPAPGFLPGILNLGGPVELQLVASTNAKGELQLPTQIPLTTFPGFDVGIQLYVLGPNGPVLSNPEVLRLVP